MTEQFYSQKVTQSEYRGGRSNSRNQSLDCKLEPIAFESAAQREALRRHVKDEIEQFFALLLPEKDADALKMNDFIQAICAKLGCDSELG